MIVATNISLAFGQRELFDKISFAFNDGQKIGLIGRNGSGKSTLLKVISRQIGLDEGQLTIASRRTIAYMPQEVVITSDKNVLDEALCAFQNLFDLKKELIELEKQIDIPDHNLIAHDVLERFAEVQAELADKDFDSLIVEAKKLLCGLGFSEAQFSRPVEHLSGGWKMRLVLAKLLLQKADFYLFDEPTNHLDIVTKDWFLEFLQNASFGFLLVCHDKYFLDHACEYIFEISRGKGRLFNGSYTQFMNQKEQESVALQTAYDEQQRDIKRKMDTINRFRAKASKAAMAQSMLRSLDKMEKIEIESDFKRIALSFSSVRQPGKIVLKVNGVAKSFEEHHIFKHASFELARGDKAAIVAANGVGKTTLLNIISGKISNDEGSMVLGHNVDFAVFEQDQEKVLDKSKTVLQECEDSCTTSEQRSKVRSLLGAFLFPGDDVYKRNSVLSGGEKNRVAMVKVLLQNANFLILDEPTNHLDMESKEILLAALQQYPGTLLFVSHDRSFLDDLATRIFELTPSGVVSYKGNYESYLYQKQQQLKSGLTADIETTQQNVNAENLTKRLSFEQEKEVKTRKRKISNLESRIHSLEKDKELLLQKFEAAEFGTDAFDEYTRKLKDIDAQMERAWKQWQELSDLK